MSTKDYVLMTVKCAGESPRLIDAATALNVPVSALDSTFGIIPIDPALGLFAVQVLSSAVNEPTEAKDYSGPFSNPRIETFGPPKSDK